MTAHRYDLTEIFDRSGYSPLHYAAFKNVEEAVYILCDFVLNRVHTPQGGDTPGGDQEHTSRDEQLR